MSEDCKTPILLPEGQPQPKGTRLIYDAQNPAPLDVTGHTYYRRIQQIKDLIVQSFINALPSNYVSQIVGPNYTTQFQVVAEQLATLQVLANEVYENTDFDFTRPEFLYQTLGSLVFPDGNNGIPDINGDRTYREFLEKMVEVLLKGSTLPSIEEAVQFLTEGATRVNELYDDPGATLDQQFGFTVDVWKYQGTTANSTPSHTHTVVLDCHGNGLAVLPVDENGDPVYDHEHVIENFEVLEGGSPAHTHTMFGAFPNNPIQYQSSLEKIMRAIKPAHTLYQLRFLFQETFRRVIRGTGEYETGDAVFLDTFSVDTDAGYYEEIRWYWEGAERIASSSGSVGSDRMMLIDNTLSFRSIRPGALVQILTGGNAGTYEVRSVLGLPFPNDATPRAYTTTAFSGLATVSNGTITDTALQNFGVLPPDSLITFTSGPNTGTYRIYAVRGNTGGPLGSAGISGSSILVDVNRIRLTQRVPVAFTSFPYEIKVDTRGRSRPREVIAEDVSSQFFI
jgi:hypothetical protein